MSKLYELITELCPDGVDIKNVGDICDTITDYTAAGSFADVAKNVKYINDGVGYAQLIRTTDLKSAFKNTDKFVYVDEHAFNYLWRVNLDSECLVLPNVGNCGEVYYVTPDILPFSYNVLGPNSILVKSSIVDNRYLFHAFQSGNFQKKLAKITSTTGQTKFNKTNFKALSLPVPPMEVQREIVRVLDSFTLLIAELIAELTARKKQYDFYRDKMLNFGDKAKIYKICELCESIADGDHMPPPKSSEGIPFITISNIDQYHNIDFENTMHAPESYYNSLAEKRKARKGDILYTVVGSYGMPVCIEDDKKFIFQRHIAILRPNKDIIKTRYMFHAMQSTDFKIQADKSAKGAAQKTIALSALGEMKMSVPSIDVQEKIIKVLDNFEAICTDLNIGLPAEIEARQKQYEYYRDLLLTFAEKGDMLLTDGRTDGPIRSELSAIKLLQYVFGYVVLPLSSVAKVFRGEYITKKNEKTGTIPVILGGQEPAYYIDRSNHDGEIVVIARSGASAGFVSYWNQPIFVTDGFGYEEVEGLSTTKYLYYVLKNIEMVLNSMKRGAGVPHVSSEALSNIRIPLPSLEEQKRIVEILDRFDALCNDLSSGLPAEIEARKKQYEYYRDKLLNFKEVK